jgi:hypothetical protein
MEDQEATATELLKSLAKEAMAYADEGVLITWLLSEADFRENLIDDRCGCSPSQLLAKLGDGDFATELLRSAAREVLIDRIQTAP